MPGRQTFVMTPGPTRIPDGVQISMSEAMMNPDVDPAFGPFYTSVLEKLQRVHNTAHDIVVLGGEGILGLETAIASTIEPGDQVLCIANGIYGEGFVDFVEMAGGEAVVVEADYREAPDLSQIERLVGDPDHEFAAATMVHCETPTGLLNDIDPILDILNEAGILSIVDAVSSLGGTPVPVDDIDLCLGASQKCFSAPPGLTTIAVSDRAWERVAATPQHTFYTSLEPWREADPTDEAPTALPYTHLVPNLYALDAALDRILEEGLDAVFARHDDVAGYCRDFGAEIGLEPFVPAELCSPTVTAFELPGEARAVQQALYENYSILVATSLGEFADDLLRIGHMGYGADREAVGRTMEAIQAVRTD